MKKVMLGFWLLAWLMPLQGVFAATLHIEQAVLVHHCDFTLLAQQRCDGRSACHFSGDDPLCGSHGNELHGADYRVRYSCNGRQYRLQGRWSGTLRVHCADTHAGHDAPAAGHAHPGREDRIRVLRAHYGEGHHVCDATAYLARRCDGDYRCSFTTGNHMCGDPLRGVRKQLQVEWQCGHRRLQGKFDEDQQGELACLERIPPHQNPLMAPAHPRAHAPAPTHSASHDGGLEIIRAVYGSSQHVCDATRAVARRCQGQSACSVRAKNNLWGDPDRGVHKSLSVRYRCHGRVQEHNVAEGRKLKLHCD